MAVTETLSPGGLLSRHIAGYEARPAQIEMAELIERCIVEAQHAVIEAGTGTGKSFAYLIPSIEGHHQTIVSTANKTLQAQLIGKDLPTLQEILPVEFTFCIAKGKSNYLCLDKLARVHPAANAIGRWIASTDTGDIDEAPRPLAPEEKERLCAGDACMGRRCPHYARCFYYQAKRRRAEADVVVTNHALLCQHMMYPDAGLLPLTPVLIVDEAHQLESYAMRTQSMDLSPFSFRGPARSLRGDGEQFLAELAGDSNQQDALVHPLLEYPSGHALADEIDAVTTEIDMEAAVDDRRRAEQRAKVDDLLALSGRVRALATQTQPGSVRHVLRRRDYLVGQVTRFDVSEFLRALAVNHHTVVYTSATLADGKGSFRYFMSRNGVTDAETLQLDSPFDFEDQARLYLPRRVRMPVPDHRNRDRFDRMARVGAKVLVEASRGGALCLYTSYHAMHAAADYLAAETPYPVKRQGEMSRAGLIRWLKSTPGAVLCATASFWEGIDVPGEALRLVVIDKIPFTPPSPVESARQRAIGGRAFLELSIPEATLRLKQGFGRLIRSQSDYGVVAILDPRLWTRPYGRLILRALPPAAEVYDAQQVATFYDEKEPEPMLAGVPVEEDPWIADKQRRDNAPMAGRGRPRGADPLFL
jgi:ATP-dependent DNA helicase DinG